MVSIFLHQKHYILEVIGYFLSCFDHPYQNSPVLIDVADRRL